MSTIFIILVSIIVAFLIVYIVGMKKGSRQQSPMSDLEEGDDDDEL